MTRDKCVIDFPIVGPRRHLRRLLRARIENSFFESGAQLDIFIARPREREIDYRIDIYVAPRYV